MSEETSKKATVFERIRELIWLNIWDEWNDIKPETNLKEDLLFDDLDHIETIMAIEEEFDIEILDEDTERLITVGDLVRYVENAL